MTINGFFSFGRLYTSSLPSLFPGSNNDYRYIVSPFWTDNNILYGREISYEVHTPSTGLLSHVSIYIRQLLDTDFVGTWMLVAEWEDVHEQSPTTVSLCIYTFRENSMCTMVLNIKKLKQ